MTPWAALAIFAAGLAAGTINVIVGSGSLITFPTLLALGYPPVLANVSNNVGLVPGSASAVVAYRRELVGQRSRVVKLGAASLTGGITGAVLLLALPSSVFKAAIPALVLLATVLMAVQPRVSAWLAARGERHVHGGAPLLVGVFLTGIYGGYFGAAQGVILISLLAIFIDDDLQRLNGTKNVAGPHRQRGGRRRVRPVDHGVVVGGRPSSPSGRSSGASSAATTAAGCPPRSSGCASWWSGWAWPSSWPSSGTEARAVVPA